MTGHPESQAFTKLVVSAGVFLVAAAFVVPGLLLRETDVLLIPQEELGALTPESASEIEKRQGTARLAGRAAPYVGAALFVAGVLLLWYGIPDSAARKKPRSDARSNYTSCRSSRGRRRKRRRSSKKTSLMCG